MSEQATYEFSWKLDVDGTTRLITGIGEAEPTGSTQVTLNGARPPYCRAGYRYQAANPDSDPPVALAFLPPDDALELRKKYVPLVQEHYFLLADSVRAPQWAAHSVARRDATTTAAVAQEASREATEVTLLWLSHLAAAGRVIIAGDWTIAKKEAALKAFLDLTTADVKIWYGVMLANAGSIRATWLLYKTTDGANIYTDILTGVGVPRQYDGQPTRLQGAHIPAGFDPEALAA